LDPEDLALLSAFDSAENGAGTVVVASKSDLPPAWEPSDLGDGHVVTKVSSVTGTGLGALRRVLTDRLVGAAAGSELWVGNERHVQALRRARQSVSAALDAGDELAALDLQDALGHLAAITGRDGVAEETLARIFARFCVGK